MANKFQKSVLERLEQDAARQKQKVSEQKKKQPAQDTIISGDDPINEAAPELTAGAIQPEAPETAGELLPGPTEAAEAPKPLTETQNGPASKSGTGIRKPVAEEEMTNIVPQAVTGPDVSGYLRISPPRLAKNKTFYLDADVIDAVKSVAKKQGVTDSKLANDILRRVLGLD